MNKIDPLVSIITPTYNHEKYIGECIESVIDQSFKNWEMIIIDDGSTDNTSKVILSYNDDRIIYLQQDNLGPYKLGMIYNKALSISKGQYIATLEGDDFWPPNKLEFQLPSFDDENVVLSHGRAKFVYECSRKRNIKNINIREINSILNNNPKGMALYGLLGAVGTSPVAVTTMFRKEALLEIGGFKQPEGIPLVDNPTNLELSLKGQFKYIKKNLGYFRRHKKSISHKIRKKEIESCSNIYKNNFLKMNYNKLNKMGIPTKDIHLSNYNKKNVSTLIVHGKELFDLCMYEDSKIVFKSIINGNKEDNITLTYKILALAGLISTYLHLDILGLIIKYYSVIESTYWNFKI